MLVLLGEGPEEAWWWRIHLLQGRTGRGCGGGRGVFYWIFLWFGRQDVYAARFPGMPPPPRVVNGGAA